MTIPPTNRKRPGGAMMPVNDGSDPQQVQAGIASTQIQVGALGQRVTDLETQMRGLSGPENILPYSLTSVVGLQWNPATSELILQEQRNYFDGKRWHPDPVRGGKRVKLTRLAATSGGGNTYEITVTGDYVVGSFVSIIGYTV